MRIPVAIYPFCPELLPIINKFRLLQNEFEVKSLIAPCGLGLAGHDAGYACNHPETGVIVTEQWNYDEDWTTLLLHQPVITHIKPDISYEEIAEQAVWHGKNVIFINTSEKMNVVIEKLSSLYPDKVEQRKYTDENSSNEIESQIFHEVVVPIVLVGGLIQEPDNFEVLLQLALKMKMEHLRTVVFTKQSFGPLFGFYDLEHIWNCSKYTEAEKIAEINYYINHIVDKERPEVILIEAPDSILRYNDYALNGFGIRTYMLGQAIAPDRFVCCIPFELAIDDFLNMINDNLEKRLGTKITTVHVSNTLIDIAEVMQTHDISFIHTDLRFVRRQILKEKKNSQIPIYNVIDNGIDGIYAGLFEDEAYE